MTEQILVTGAAGFVGQHLVSRLAREGHSVTALDIRPQAPDRFAAHLGDNINYMSGSILHEDFIRTEVFLSPTSYDRIFHLAGVVGVDRYVDVQDPLYLIDVNINGTKLLLELARGSNARFVYTSTSEIYGRNPDVPWHETDGRVLGPPTQDRWSYSNIKAVNEHMIHMLGAVDSGLSTTVVRPFNLYGPGQRNDFVVAKFLNAVQDGCIPIVYGDGDQRRCFTYIDDFIDGLVTASERPLGENETYNLGGTQEIEISRLAELALDIGGRGDESPSFVDPAEIHGPDYDEPVRRVPDISRARERLGWEPTVPLEEGLRRTYESMTSQI